MRGKIKEIYFLKGIAILGVLLIHISASNLRFFKPLSGGGIFLVINQLSRYSVPIFFIISGLLLFYRYAEIKPFPIVDFYKKRIIYIISPFLFWSIFYILFNYIFIPENLPHEKFTLAKDFIEGKSYYHLYYLFVMVQFYLLLPILLWLFRQLDGLIIVSFSLIITIIAHTMTWHDLNILYPVHFDEYTIRSIFLTWVFFFCFGGWIGIHFERFRSFIERVPLFVMYTLFVLTASLLFYNVYIWKHDGFYATPVILYSIIVLVICFRIASAWGSSCVSLLGKHSFGIYLIHPFIQYLIFHYINPLLPKYSWLEFGFTLFSVTGLSLLLTIIIGKLPYSYLIKGR